MDNDHDHSQGTVLSVRGSVVDARFPGGLPEFHSELHVGTDREVVVEVVGHVDTETIRGIALNPTAGGRTDAGPCGQRVRQCGRRR